METRKQSTSEIYFKLYSKIEAPSPDGTYWMISQRNKQLEDIYSTLKIESEYNNWQSTVDSHNAIVNRQPMHSQLIIGCGNIPEFSETVGDVYFIDNYGGDKYKYRSNHGHHDADTIDPDFARNPTIVAEFGKTPIHELFNNHQYNEIIIEGIRILPWDLQSVGSEPSPYAIDSLIALLEVDGIVNDNGQFYTKSFLEQYRENNPSNRNQYKSSAMDNSCQSDDPLLSWEPSIALANKFIDIQKNELCEELEDFLKKYDLTFDDLALSEVQLDHVLNVHLWCNFELYILRPSMNKYINTKQYSAHITNSIFSEQCEEQNDISNHIPSYRKK